MSNNADAKRIYLSGPMTGRPNLNRDEFNYVAGIVRGLGHIAVNPAELCAERSLTWEQCMRIDIRALCDCDTLLLLDGFQESKGAMLELQLAHRLGIKVLIFSDAHGLKRDLWGFRLAPPHVREAYA